MKRSQLDEDNCGHWEYEVQYPIIFPEVGTPEQCSTPRSFGTNTRRLRFSRASSRELTMEMNLEGMTSRVHQAHSTLQRARTDVLTLGLTEQGLDRNTSTTMVGANGNSTRLHENSGSSMGVLDTTENSMFEVYDDQIPGSVASIQGLVGEISQTSPSDLLLEVMPGADKENRDPLGEWNMMPRRSPLPEWFPRKPLQDITNVLAADLDAEQPQPKKKRNKKVSTILAPALFTLCGPPVNKSLITTEPKPFSRAASNKQASNLRKNFR